VVRRDKIKKRKTSRNTQFSHSKGALFEESYAVEYSHFARMRRQEKIVFCKSEAHKRTFCTCAIELIHKNNLQI